MDSQDQQNPHRSNSISCGSGISLPSQSPRHGTSNHGADGRDSHAKESRERRKRHETPDITRHARISHDITSHDTSDEVEKIVMPFASTPPTRGTQQMTEMDLKREACVLVQSLLGSEGAEMAYCFQYAAKTPPITLESLVELEIARIINNPKLRHDINFDRELHFRPNLDGSKGRQKLKLADQFWTALTAEFELYAFIGKRLMAPQDQQRDYWQRMMKSSQQRLPGIFTAIKDILKTLVPDQDQLRVDERLNIPMIMQQVENSVLDLLDLTEWFSKLLKSHCAPMRDSWIDQMVKLAKRGVQEDSPKRIVRALQQLLSILEAMKLDVANHQIRHLRGLLIEDTINYHQRFQLHRITCGKIDVVRALQWYEREQRQFYSSPPAEPIHVFASAILRLISSHSTLSVFPETFSLDAERLRALRTDLHALINMGICTDVLDCLSNDKVLSSVLDAAKLTFQQSLNAIIGEGKRWTDKVDNIAVELMRTMLRLRGSTITYDAELLSCVETMLRAALQPSGTLYSTKAKVLMGRMLPKLVTSMQKSVKLSTVALHDAMVPPATPIPPPFDVDGTSWSSLFGKPAERDPEEEIVRRIAHLGVLHWQVWAPLVYVAAEEDTEPMAGPNENRSITATPGGGGPTKPPTPSLDEASSAEHNSPGIEVTITSSPPPSPRPESESKPKPKPNELNDQPPGPSLAFRQPPQR
ncbi:Protein SOSEKI 1 [Elasticomyces elasticus]|nr:Protein SOSEKI 1 [Elasticomyces elasticus]